MNTKTSTPAQNSKIQVRSAVRAGAAPAVCRSCCSHHDH